MLLSQFDLDLIAERTRAVFSTPEAHLALEQSGWLDEAPTKDFRVQLATLDYAFFARFYLRQHFTKPFGSIHLDLIKELQRSLNTPGRVNSVVIMPRGFGKTTLVTLGAPAWAVCCQLRKYIIICSDSSEQADLQLENLKDELEANVRILEDFGVQRGSEWAKGRFVTATDIRVEALGAGKKIRGRKYKENRPDLIIFDDIENLEEVKSETQRESRKKWYRQAAMRAGWEDTKTLTVGNLLHADCLLAELMQNPMYRRRKHSALVSWATDMKLWDEWEAIVTDKSLDNDTALENGLAFYHANQEAMDEGGESTWPEVYPYYELMLIRASEGHTAFATELLNDPADPSTALFKVFKRFKTEIRLSGSSYETWLIPLTGQPSVRMQDCALFGFTDPSLGRNLASDFSAIIILARAPHGLMFVIQSDIRRRSPNATIQAQNAWAQKLNIARWGIETNQFQAFYFTESGAKARAAGISLPLVPVNQTKNKEVRVQSLEPDINNGWILFPEHGAELLIEQLSWYGFTTHDDGPDALEGARTLALRWEGMTSVQISQGEAHTFGDFERDPLEPIDPWAGHDDAALAVLEDRALDLEIDLIEAASDTEGAARVRIQDELDAVQAAISAEHKDIFVPYVVTGR